MDTEALCTSLKIGRNEFFDTCLVLRGKQLQLYRQPGESPCSSCEEPCVLRAALAWPPLREVSLHSAGRR